MDSHRGFVYSPKFRVRYLWGLFKSVRVMPATNLLRRCPSSAQRVRSEEISWNCPALGKEAGERPSNRSIQIHSAPQIWARVSRTEEKLEPRGLLNCSAVSAAAASRERRLAQAL